MKRRWLHAIGGGLAVCLFLSCARAPESTGNPPGLQADGGEVSWIDTGPGRLKAKVYRSARVDGLPALVVVLHGDSPSAPPTYQYRFARQAAARADTAAVFAAILRPGYSDGEHRSDGTRGLATGDNYTPEVVDAVAQAVAILKARHRAGRVILVGHSGGATTSADLLGRHPGIADAALLVSCACDVPAWRRHMRVVRGGSVWDEPVSSISPMDVTWAVPRSTQVRMVVGGKDEVTPPDLTAAYAAALRENGVPVLVATLPDLSHNILGEPVVFEALQRMLARSDGR
jgi:pimeloyl-ACP methyl ester carboxylesterase